MDRKTCRWCGVSVEQVGTMSWTGACPSCGSARLEENMRGISEHRGPAFERWRSGILRAFGGTPVDEPHVTR